MPALLHHEGTSAVTLPPEAAAWTRRDRETALQLIAGRTVVASSRDLRDWLDASDPTLSVFVDHDGWANPFVAGRDGDGLERLHRYAEEYLPAQSEVSIDDLRGKALRYTFAPGIEMRAQYLADLANDGLDA
jgi:hypothetical protein